MRMNPGVKVVLYMLLLDLLRFSTCKTVRPCLYGEKLSRVEGSPAYPSYPGRANFSYISLKTWRTVYMRNKKLARLEGLPT